MAISLSLQPIFQAYEKVQEGCRTCFMEPGNSGPLREAGKLPEKVERKNDVCSPEPYIHYL